MFHKMLKEVEEFHRKHGAAVGLKKTVPLELLRNSLTMEELSELQLAAWREDWAKFFDAVGDLCYVLVGNAVSYGWGVTNVLHADRRPAAGMNTDAVQFDSVHLGRQLMGTYSSGISRAGVQQSLMLLYGFCDFHRIPLEEIFSRVHASNMTKTASGDQRVSNKGPDFVAPVFDDLVAAWRAA
jgi:predicted HAD superfamily Cof-like phosphohydrolase